jgi:catechol-2,3-dioxygenase
MSRPSSTSECLTSPKTSSASDAVCWPSCGRRCQRTTTTWRCSRSAKAHPVGLFHFALEVKEIDDLVAAQARLEQEGCFQGASDHGATKAVYGSDPDGNTFELTWIMPRAEWGEWERVAPIKKPIDLNEAVRLRRDQQQLAA